MLYLRALFDDRDEHETAATISWITSQIKSEQLQSVWSKLGSTQRGWIKKYLELHRYNERESFYPLPRCDMDDSPRADREFHQ